MIRRLFLLLCWGASLVSVRAASAGFSGGADVAEGNAAGEFLWKGRARLREEGALLTADEIRGNNRTGVAVASGNVMLTRGTMRLLADKLVYQIGGTFSAENVRLGSFPYYAEGASAMGDAKEVTVAGATLTYGEPGPWQPSLMADRVIYGPGRQVRSENSFVGIGGARPLPFPKFQQNLATPLLPFASVAAGYRSSLGIFAEAGLHVPLALGFRAGGDVGLYSQRGVMFGPAATYNRGEHGRGYRGYLRSGYINDHGARGEDILGRPVPEERAFLEWEHQQTFSEQLTLKARANWWKDSEVVRDFRARLFFPVQEPDTYLEAAYEGKNYLLSLFARFQPNSFHQVQERLPELRFDLLPLALPGGFSERFNASIAVLREDPLPVGPLSPIAGPGLRSDRFDAYYALSRPIVPNDWFAFTPVVGGRITHYANTSGVARAGSYTRTLGEVGFDATMRTAGTFAYKNEQWKIDGLRHLFNPRLSYRYVPQGDRGHGRIPRIDRRDVFSTYLQPLGLGDVRNIDDLQATNTLRVGFDNTLQTRDATYGSRDLLVFNVASDFRYKRLRTERDISEIHTEIALMPTTWLRADIYQSFTPQTLTLREFNSAVTLHDGTAWSLRFSNNFLRGELHDYALEGRARINETFEALTRLNYDVRKNRFNEQAYGIVQNLGNTWQISYVVSLYSGRRRESSFGFNVQIDALRF